MLLAGLFGGILQRQQSEEVSAIHGFLTGIRKHYWRMLAANLLSLILYFVAILILIIAGVVTSDSAQNQPLVLIIAGIDSMVSLFWYTAIVVERRLFRGLLHAVKTLLFNPYALAIGITWAALSAADTFFFDAPGNQNSLALNGIRAAVLAAARILVIAYTLAIYKQARGEAPADLPEGASLPESSSTTSGEGWVWASFGFAFIAFIPLMSLVALTLGIIALKRKKRFVLRSVFACLMGGFFTLFHFLIIAGWIANSTPSNAPGYAFLAEANADLKQQVSLLEQGSVQDLQLQLEQSASKDPERDWTLDAISALAKYRDNDLAGALDAFRIAAEKEPERGEFYYYYGVALLDNGQTEMAASQFQTALEHEPKLEAAARYLSLIKTTYQPSSIASALMMVVILLILFTVHEYGHAYTAWKLGDDTAKSRGRLTLNPIPHLDLIGSIVLPGLLLWQQAGVVFGWAKPVPVNPENFQNPRKDHMRVAFAGPAVNLIVSLVCFVVLGFLMLFVRMVWPGTLSLNLANPFSPVSIVGPPAAQWLVFIVVFLKQMFYTSLILGCFNLIPIPPLDGSWILSGFLPVKFSPLFEKMRRFGFVIFLLLMFTSAMDYIMAVPLIVAGAGLQILFSAMGLG
jgi:Zn-dependent protease